MAIFDFRRRGTVSSGFGALQATTRAIAIGILMGSAMCHAEDGSLPGNADEPGGPPEIHVKSCDDFDVEMAGLSTVWDRAEWVPMNRRPNGRLDYETQFKILHSGNGIYILFDSTDQTLTATMTEDFQDLWNEDVFECFLWPDDSTDIYFEYEISPLGHELPILVPNVNGKFLGWRPWHYEGDRRVRKEVLIVDGSQQSGAAIKGWQAEVFIPYPLLTPLQNVPAQKGGRWRANFYRVDYDSQRNTGWDWARVGPSFHDIQNFGTLIFE